MPTVDIFRAGQPDQLPFRCRHHSVTSLMVSQITVNFFERYVGTKRDRPCDHDLFGCIGAGLFDDVTSHQAQDNALIVHNRAGTGRIKCNARLHSADLVAQSAGYDVTPGDRAEIGDARGRPLDGEAGGDPIEFARLVNEDAGETETLEPPRGSWAHVSLRVVAVGDDRPGLIELAGGRAVQFAQRDADGAGKMLLVILRTRQHLYQLRSALEHLANAGSVNYRRHPNLLWSDHSWERGYDSPSGLAINRRAGSAVKRS